MKLLEKSRKLDILLHHITVPSHKSELITLGSFSIFTLRLVVFV